MEKRKSPRKSKSTNLKSLKLRIGRNIRKKRLDHGWTQEDMAVHGFNARHYQDVERGLRDVSLSYLWRLARVFDVDVLELVADMD